MSARTSEPSDIREESLIAAAELLGRLLLREVEGRDLERLRDPGVSQALEQLGIALPSVSEESEWLEQRAAEYHDHFLRPDPGPLVQSLWTEGRYEGDSAVRLRQLASTAGFEYERTASRGAAIDHLGAILLLWCAAQPGNELLGNEIAAHHLKWADAPLAKIQGSGGFYGAVAASTRELLRAIAETTP